MAIPYALEADGQIIQLFDLNSHRPVVPAGTPEDDVTKAELTIEGGFVSTGPS